MVIFKLKEFFLITLLCILFETDSTIAIGPLSVLMSSKEILSNITDFLSHVDNATKNEQQPILTDFNEISNKIEILETEDKERGEWILEAITKLMKSDSTLMELIKKIKNVKSKIESRNNEYKNLMKNLKTFEGENLIEFAKKQLQSNESIKDLLDQLSDYYLVTKSGDESALEILSNILETIYFKQEGCALGGSPQQFLLAFYDNILRTEFQAFKIALFSHTVLKMNSKDEKNLNPLTLIKSQISDRIMNGIKNLINALKVVDGSVWTCDPKTYIQGQTYEEMILLQDILVNLQDLDGAKTCSSSSGNIKCKSELCKNQFKCVISEEKCKVVENPAICPSPKAVHHRYEYIESSNKGTMNAAYKYIPPKVAKENDSIDATFIGDIDELSCPQGLIKYYSNSTENQFCSCFCYEQEVKSGMYFDLRGYNSSTGNNMVVTGVRFMKNNDIIHLQIQEGKLEGNGYINPDSLKWVSPHNYTVSDPNVKNMTDYLRVCGTGTNNFRRSMQLGDIIAHNSSYVVTGVRLQPDDRRLYLETYSTKFEYSTGKLEIKNSKNERVPKKENQAYLYDSNLPTTSSINSTPVKDQTLYIFFVIGGRHHYMLPFIDIQNVAPKIPVPLSGVGIYYKTANDVTAGFVAPKLITYNFASQLELIVSNKNGNSK